MRQWKLFCHNLEKEIGNMGLWSRNLGKVVSGMDLSLHFTEFEMNYPKLAMPVKKSTVFHSMVMRSVLKEVTYRSSSSTDWEFMDMFKEESIGVDLTVVNIF